MSKKEASKTPKKKHIKKKQEVSFCELKESIDHLENRIDKANSIKRVFWKGVLTGLGASIGATIIFALLISTASWIIDETDASWLQNLIETTGIDKAINK